MDNKTQLYLDTSIISACFDYKKAIRQFITEKWFQFDSKNFELYISPITLKEIHSYQNPIEIEKRENLIASYSMKNIPFSTDAKDLANEYIQKGAIPKTEPEDAYHIAIATVNRISNLASWNFKHIVSINPIRKIHEINLNNNYPLIEIGTLEIFGGSKYGNL